MSTPYRALGCLLLLLPLMASAQADDPATAAVAAAPASAPPSTGMRAMFRDSEDGRFDMSRWLLEHRGFLPVPIIITDPAVGNGGGVALAFFHKPASTPAPDGEGGTQKMATPDIYGGGAMRTENGSEAYGLGASLHFDEDRWRYRGGVAKASFNLGFYTPGTRLPATEIEYNVDGLMSFQQGFRRIGERDLFVGLAWIYMDMDIGFDVASDRDRFQPHELATRSSGLGLSLEYDTRDNPFTRRAVGWA